MKKLSFHSLEFEGWNPSMKENGNLHFANEDGKAQIANEVTAPYNREEVEKPPVEPQVKKPGKGFLLILMATFESAAFTKLRNSFGNLTACKHKGQNVVKEKITEVNDPNTLPQQMQRKRFPATVALAAAFSQVIAIGLRGYKLVKQTVENCFVQLNKACVTVNEEMEVSIDFERLVVSKGKRALLTVVETTLDVENRQLSVVFETEEDEEEFVAHSSKDDLMFCYLVEKSTLKGKLSKVGTRASMDGGFTVTIPRKWEATADNIAAYFFCTDKKMKQASDTLYLEIK